MALIELSGTVDGGVDGVVSEIELQAKMNFDLRNKRIVWLTLAMTLASGLHYIHHATRVAGSASRKD